MAKKVLNELEWEEMTALYEKNNWLRDQIASEAVRMIEDCRDDILHYLRSNKHIHYEIGGIADYISTDTQHANEYIDLVETMYNDGVINLPYSRELVNLSLSFYDARYFF